MGRMMGLGSARETEHADVSALPTEDGLAEDDGSADRIDLGCGGLTNQRYLSLAHFDIP